MKLSAELLDRPELCDGNRERIIFDEDIPGFGLYLHRGGARTLVFQYKLGEKQRRMTLAKATSSTFDAARTTAARLLARVRAGEEAVADRLLTDDELRLIWTCAGDDPCGGMVQLLMLTALYKNEIAGLQWSDLHGRSIELSGERTRNRRPHALPLSTPARAILAAEAEKSGRSDALHGAVFGDQQLSQWPTVKQRLDQAIARTHGRPIPSWGMHHLRHTVANRMADRLGIRADVIDAVLNRVSSHKPAAASSQARRLSEQSAAVELWAAHLMEIVEDRRHRPFAPAQVEVTLAPPQQPVGDEIVGCRCLVGQHRAV